MPSPAALQRVLRELRGLAEANLWDFASVPGLTAEYAAALRWGRFKYIDDLATCGDVDCWSTFISLRDRYRSGPLLADCEDLASAHAAYLSLKGEAAMVGVVPGQRISHAVCGVLAPNGRDVRLLDPSVWAGMRPLGSYSGIWWARVRSAAQVCAACAA